jgi:GNAT superfamily N-acetyltransferase
MSVSGSIPLRRATRADALSLADIHTTARAAAMPWLRVVHTNEETRWWMSDVVLRRLEVWVAECDRKISGFMALHEDWIEQLYVDPSEWRRSVGSALLDHAKQRRPDGFRLWTFQRNAMARAFYRKHGLVDIRETDGSANEEKEPDVLLEWRPDHG